MLHNQRQWQYFLQQFLVPESLLEVLECFAGPYWNVHVLYPAQPDQPPC